MTHPTNALFDRLTNVFAPAHAALHDSGLPYEERKTACLDLQRQIENAHTDADVETLCVECERIIALYAPKERTTA